MGHNDILLEVGTNEVEVVVFRIDEPQGAYSWHFGVNVAKVLEIIRMPAVTHMPEASHESILGAFRLRERIIPLVDLGVWLGVDISGDREPKVVVTEFNNVVTAFKVSGVDRIFRMSWEDIEPPSRQLSKFSTEVLTGVIKREKHVVFVLDLEKMVHDLNPATAMHTELGEDFHAGGYKALIVDDSTSIRHLIGNLLTKAGFEVIRTINGKMAWEFLLEAKEKAGNGASLSDFVDVVITDIEMPVMDGHTLTRRIKEDPVLKVLPVIQFSSIIMDSLTHKGVSVGADHQISKPELAQVAITAKQLIDERRAGS